MEKIVISLFFIYSYDTFEMLRENLDTVLKELLEFKPNEKVKSVYPGPRLDVEDNFLKHIFPNQPQSELENLYVDVIEADSREILNKTAIEENRYDISAKGDKSEIVSRIRRFLDKKSKQIMKPVSEIKYKMHKYLHRNKKQRDVKRHDTKNRAMSVNSRNIRKRSANKNIPNFNTRKLLALTRKHKNKPAKLKRDTIITEVRIHETGKKKSDPANGDATLKARFLFKSCMNYEILQKRGHRPLLDLLELLGGWPILDRKWNSSNFDWLELMAKLRLYNNDILISEWVGPDIKNSDEFVIQFDQTSLGKSSNVTLNEKKKCLVSLFLHLKYDYRFADKGLLSTRSEQGLFGCI